jgi:hypothetical protein
MRVEHLALLLVGQLVYERPRARQGVGLVREPLDEARAPLEQPGELVRAQLPR